MARTLEVHVVRLRGEAVPSSQWSCPQQAPNREHDASDPLESPSPQWAIREGPLFVAVVRADYAGDVASGKKRAKKKQLEFRNTQLADALQTQDIAAVAFALRHGPTVVPLMRAGARDDPRDAGEVWTYRDPDSGDVALLLFSDAVHKPETLPPAVGLHSAAWLRAFLGAHADQITTVFFDIAGPHPMQASPADIIAALDA